MAGGGRSIVRNRFHMKLLDLALSQRTAAARAARRVNVESLSASALPIGICGDGPSADAVGRSLAESGAARTLTDWTDIRGVLP